VLTRETNQGFQKEQRQKLVDDVELAHGTRLKCIRCVLGDSVESACHT
jgi:hypothetical protein